jgi:hypothetical protein
MAEQTPSPNGQFEHPSVRYEKTDAGRLGVLLVLGASVGLAAVTYLGVWGFYTRYRDHLAVERRSPYPLATTPANVLPPEPRLEQLDRLSGVGTELARRQARERLLRSYGTTADKGYVHIPIERAMALVAGKLPVRAEAVDHGRDQGLVAAGEPNSGRMFRKETRWLEP